MTSSNQDILLAKIDTLYYSLADPQLQSIVSLIRDLAANVDIEDKGELGFGQHPKTTE